MLNKMIDYFSLVHWAFVFYTPRYVDNEDQKWRLLQENWRTETSQTHGIRAGSSFFTHPGRCVENEDPTVIHERELLFSEGGVLVFRIFVFQFFVFCPPRVLRRCKVVQVESITVFTLEDGKRVMTGFSSDEFPVWCEFVNRNPSGFYRHEFIYRRKRDGKQGKFVRKNLGRDLSGYLASTPAKSPPVWIWIPFYLQTSCWALENEAFPIVFAHRIQLQLIFFCLINRVW